jgi:ribosomal protein S18 acetylase RimI-like enzyme
MTAGGGPATDDDGAPITVRPYEPGDRDAVRRICFDTGYMGASAAWCWADGESFADLWSSYYTDREPESALVAVRDGRVVGYLLGCRDTTRSGSPIGAIRRHLIRRGLLVRPGMAPILWRSGFDLVRDRRHDPRPRLEFDDPRWPAHLHIDLLPEARGAGVGAQLMHAWLHTLRAARVPGCHLGTWGENTSAIAFFEAMGFRREGPPELMAGMRTPGGSRHTTQWMVQDLDRRTT